MDAVFLGLNEAGEKAYNWLNQREDVEVKALLTEEDQLSLIKELQPELVIASGFEHKVPEDIIEVPEKGIVNLHPSFLPYNRGSHPYIWPIIEGTPAGVSIHYMNAEIDEGPVIDKREVPVRPEDTAENLYSRLQEEQFLLFTENWGRIKQGAKAREQDLDRGQTHREKDLEKISELDLGEETVVGDLLNRLRALSFPPKQTAYFVRNGKKYYVNVEINEAS
jgi:methionyl-tRNA formyltransferase